MEKNSFKYQRCGSILADANFKDRSGLLRDKAVIITD